MNSGRKDETTNYLRIQESNNAPIQQVGGKIVRNVSQTVHPHAPSTVDEVRRLLADFRREIEQKSQDIPADQRQSAGDAAATIEANLDDAEAGGPALRTALRALPTAIAGTVVEQAGTALAQAVRALVN